MKIHQEVSIAAPPSAVFGVLTSSGDFIRMTGGRSAVVSGEVGGAISLFGGDIEGRNVELVPGRRVVQAWGSKSWPAGVWSIVRFELAADPKGTRLTFDQTGYPDDAHAMLEGGWPKMYWEPMNALLGGG